MLSMLSASEEEKDKVVSDTLEWCNELRKKKGLEPLAALPKGKRWDGASCPCGRACGYYVGYAEYFDVILGADEDIPSKYSPGTGIGLIPHSVEIFTRRFDNGELPEYESKE